MKLLYDLYSSQGHGNVKYHGGGTYGQNLLIELIQKDIEALELTIIASKERSINSNLIKVLDKSNLEILYINSENELITELLKDKYNVFYTAMPYYLSKYKSKLRDLSTKILGTIHGLREIELSYDSSYRSYLRSPIAKLKQSFKYFFPGYRLKNETKFYNEIVNTIDGNILTVSNHTKHQILNVFPNIKSEQILVLNPIEKPVSSSKKNDISKFNLDKKGYFLLTSCDRPVKNTFRALDAFNEYNINGADRFKICCIGFRKHQIKYIQKNYKRIIDKIVFLDYLEREELETIIKNAFSFLYPSISEGFGYPPLEAMRNSVPVLASSHTAITEVCGDSVLYFNPFSSREIANRISQIIDSDELYKELVKLGHVRYEVYNQKLQSQIDKIIDFIIMQ